MIYKSISVFVWNKFICIVYITIKSFIKFKGFKHGPKTVSCPNRHHRLTWRPRDSTGTMGHGPPTISKWTEPANLHSPNHQAFDRAASGSDPLIATMIGLLFTKYYTDDGRPEEMAINSLLRLQTATGNIASALGFGALAWSTVVHLSGFVGELRDLEFWIVTALSFVMACK